MSLNHYDVVIAPHITEKATLLSEHNAVVFKVAGDASTLIAIRRMQQDAHYLVAPPYVVAMSRQ